MAKESIIEFPCEFLIKIIGKNNPDFECNAIVAIRPFVPDLGEGAVTERASKKGNYLGLTVKINAHTQEQLDNIYRALNALPDVIMVL